MPELPETETIARDLQRLLAGRSIAKVTVHRPDVLRGGDAQAFQRHSEGRSIVRVWRRAKSVILALSHLGTELGDGVGGRSWGTESGDGAGSQSPTFLVVQPRFTGAVLVDAAADADAAGEYTAVEWTLADGGRFVYRDVRRLGTVTMLDEAGLSKYNARIGPEPLDPSFDSQRLSGILRVSSQAVKKVLMDQRLLAGVGNIYANEALWRAGIDPSRPANSVGPNEVDRLHSALTEILRASIAERGTTFRDYRDPANRPGGYAARLLAYGRGGEACARCGATLIETNAIDGRSTVFCYRCQG